MTTEIGRPLTAAYGEPISPPAGFLRSVNGLGVELLDRNAAVALFDEQSADQRLRITGHPDDTAGGFSWTNPGAHPPRTQVVRPVALPPRPLWPAVLTVTIKLLFPAVAGERLERRFRADFVSPLDAYNAACCMWSTRATGYGALAAVLVDEATGKQYPVEEMAKTCGQYPPEAMANLAKTGTDALVPAPPQTGAPTGDPLLAVSARIAEPRGRGAATAVSDPRRDRCRSQGIGAAPRPQSAVMP